MRLQSKLRKATLGFVLLAGAFGGMPMRPEEIEELLQAHTADEIVQVVNVEDEEEEADEVEFREDGGRDSAGLPDLRAGDLRACLAFAADRKQNHS